jgi:LPXTG-motif cell wall-anchored protein
LYEIIRIAVRTQSAAQPPDDGLCAAHQFAHGDIVAFSCRFDEMSEVLAALAHHIKSCLIESTRRKHDRRYGSYDLLDNAPTAGNFLALAGDLDSMRTPYKHALASAAASVAVLLAAGGITSAHINPDPPAIEAGSTATIGFKIEHGCDNSPTTRVKFQIPDGVTGVTPVDKVGWTALAVGKTVEFRGGPLGADQEDHFDITLTAPAQAGDLHFPIIQTCQVGELAWIEIAAEGAAEPEHPAPTLKVTEGPPTSADLMPEPPASDAATDAVTDAATASTTAAGGVAVATISPTVIAPHATSSSNTGTTVVVVIAALALIGGGFLVARRRKSTPTE